MNSFRMMLLGTVAVGLTAAAVSTASAGEVEKTAAFSGFVNRMITIGDDGKDGFLRHADPTSIAGSRIRGVGSANSESLSVSATIELGTQRNTDQGGGAPGTQHTTGGGTVNVRHSYVKVGNNMGSLRIGHTGHAGNGISGVDVSSTGNAAAMAGGAIEAILLHTSGSTASAAGAAIGTTYFDGTLSRASGISYDTPDFNGFSATVGHYDSGSGAAEVDYSADYDGTAVNLHGGYARPAGDAIDSQYGGGLGIKLASGISLSANYAKANNNNIERPGVQDAKAYWGKIGYDMNALDAGTTGVSLMYGKYDDVNSVADDNDTSKRWGVQVQQALSDYGTSVYGGYEHHTYDTSAANFDSVSAFFAGVKVDF